MMVTLQGVIILRITDFRRFFEWGEFWSKKDDYLSLFKDEIKRRSQAEEYFFVDNDEEFCLLQKFYEWQTNPGNELQRVKLEETKLKIWAECGEVIEYQLGRLQETIEATKKQGYLTSNTMLGYTLLYLLLGANEINSEIEVEYNHNKGSIFRDLYKSETLLSCKKSFPLRYTILTNKNNDKIYIKHNNATYELNNGECITGLFNNDKCYTLLQNTQYENGLKYKLVKLGPKATRLYIMGNFPQGFNYPQNTHFEKRKDGTIDYVYIDDVISFIIHPYGNGLATVNMDGNVCISGNWSILRNKIERFKEKYPDEKILFIENETKLLTENREF